MTTGLMLRLLYWEQLAKTLHSRCASGVAAPAADWLLTQKPRLGTTLVVVLRTYYRHDRHGNDHELNRCARL